MSKDGRLMEDFLPMQAICAQPSHEKSVHEGHVFTLHFWWPAERGIICPTGTPATSARPSTAAGLHCAVRGRIQDV